MRLAAALATVTTTTMKGRGGGGGGGGGEAGGGGGAYKFQVLIVSPVVCFRLSKALPMPNKFPTHLFDDLSHEWICPK